MSKFSSNSQSLDSQDVIAHRQQTLRCSSEVIVALSLMVNLTKNCSFKNENGLQIVVDQILYFSLEWPLIHTVLFWMA